MFLNAARERLNALITVSGTLIDRYAKRIMDLAIKNHLPSMHEKSDYVDAGGLMSYTADDDDQYRRVAYYVDRILKGTKPGDLPVEQPTKFELVINLKTAKQIGLTIPPNVLVRGGSGHKMTFWIPDRGPGRPFRLAIFDYEANTRMKTCLSDGRSN